MSELAIEYPFPWATGWVDDGHTLEAPEPAACVELVCPTTPDRLCHGIGGRCRVVDGIDLDPEGALVPGALEAIRAHIRRAAPFPGTLEAIRAHLDHPPIRVAWWADTAGRVWLCPTVHPRYQATPALIRNPEVAARCDA